MNSVSASVRLGMSVVIGVAVSSITASGAWASVPVKLKASDATEGDCFGSSVAINGDTAIVDAHLGDVAGGVDQGSAYFFRRTDTGWVEEAKLTASDAAAEDRFGCSVALEGDTAIVGAYSDRGPSGDMGQGSAYVFARNGGSWTEEAKLTASDAAEEDQFGVSVALNGDTAIVGAYGDEDAGGRNQGSAYIFTRSGASWAEETKLTASGTDLFGVSVALDGDTAIVGAFSGGRNMGWVYIFSRSGGYWTNEAKLTASDAAAHDRFGTSVAVDGDTTIVGAIRAGGHNRGSAYVFERFGRD